MPYITREPIEATKLICSHPRVEKIWDFGFMSFTPSSEAVYTIVIILDDETRKDFRGEDPFMVQAETEEFLSTLK